MLFDFVISIFFSSFFISLLHFIVFLIIASNFVLSKELFYQNLIIVSERFKIFWPIHDWFVPAKGKKILLQYPVTWNCDIFLATHSRNRKTTDVVYAWYGCVVVMTAQADGWAILHKHWLICKNIN